MLALLPGQRKSTYKFVFNELHNKAIELNTVFNSSAVLSDFEGALAEVVRAEQILLISFL